MGKRENSEYKWRLKRKFFLNTYGREIGGVLVIIGGLFAFGISVFYLQVAYLNKMEWLFRFILIKFLMSIAILTGGMLLLRDKWAGGLISAIAGAIICVFILTIWLILPFDPPDYYEEFDIPLGLICFGPILAIIGGWIGAHFTPDLNERVLESK